ncbi:helix-turn-helix domain-containing protein [Variovorax sp. RT4R15]|uniref:helix-turn-helix domain-containing protein n=1 Tax=Variovorax sp. RT4R15 TaxID=3443737 RepID=UPI003F45EE55
MQKTIDNEIKAAAVARYQSGEAARNIAKDCGVALSTVYDWIGGVERRQPARRKAIPLVLRAVWHVPNSVFDLAAR